MNLSQAIKDLRDDIEAEGFDAEIMAEIAKDNGCAPQLLERKFAEQYNVHPSEYVAPKGLDPELQIAAAKRRAAEYVEANLKGVGSVPHGIVFKRPGVEHKTYVTVAFMGNYLIAIRVETNEVRNITFANRASCERFIAKQGMV